MIKKIMSEKNTKEPTNPVENLVQINEAYIFDVDGVISDPGEKKPTIDGVLEAIAYKLSANEPIALNTGRSLSWVIEKVISPLLLKVKDKKSLQNFFAVGEKGGTWLTFDQDGEMTEHKDDSITVPQELSQTVRELVESEFSDTTFFDDSKLTMLSTEMLEKHKNRIEEIYRPAQEKLTPRLQQLLKQRGIDNNFKVDPTNIATDVENKHVGKDFAVRRIINWINSRGFKPKLYATFGDSWSSDITMAEEIHRQGLPVEFVYVGNKSKIAGIDTASYPFPVVTTNEEFERGTLEYLKGR